MVLVSTKDKRKIYEFLLQEGVFACKKVSYLFSYSLFFLFFNSYYSQSSNFK